MKKVLRGIAFAILLFLAVNAVYHIVSWKDTTGDYVSSVQQLYHTDEELIDVLFVGSSHCYCSVYPDYLWRDSGIAAFDLAISGQDKWASYYSVAEALKTQNPKVVAVECYGLLYEGYESEGNKYRNLLSYKLSPDNVSLIKKVAERENQVDYILRWPIVHTRYRELEQYDFVQYEPSVYGRGASYSWGVDTGPYFPWILSCNETAELSEENKRWLDDLIDLSEKEDFTLIFFVAPKFVDAERQKVFNGAAEYVSERGVDFVDFGKLSEKIGLDSDSDFMDGNHCNAYGAAKVTGYMRDYLTEHFDLEDHRGEKAYELWDKSYRYYCRLEAERELNGNTAEMGEYLSKALQDEDLTVILTLEGSREEYSAELVQCLESLGISGQEYSRGGKWVWRNGQCIFSMDSADTRIYLLDLSDTDTLKLENRSAKYGESAAGNVMINRDSYGSSDSGMTVLLYDDFRGVVTGVRQLR